MAFWFEDEEYKKAGIKSYLFLVGLVVIAVGGLYLFYSDNQQLNSKGQGKNLQQPNTAPVESRQLTKEEAVTKVVEEVGPAVVKLTIARREKRFNIFAWETKKKVSGQGSGVILNKQGYIVTNNHVIKQSDQIKVTLPKQNKEYQAQVVGRDAVTDLAVIKIKAPEQELAPITFADSGQLQVGQLTIAIGTPYGFSNTVTTGVVSAVGRKLPLQEKTELTNMIQTDAAINPGNSGGALLNSQGEVIGINTAIIEQGQGMGFAIPSNTVKSIVQQLINNGEVVRPWIGIYGAEVTPRLTREYQLNVEAGVYVFKVVDSSPAEKSGLQPGDIIVKLNGERITDMEQLKAVLHRYQVGKKIHLTFYREDREKQVKLKLGELPQ